MFSEFRKRFPGIPGSCNCDQLVWLAFGDLGNTEVLKQYGKLGGGRAKEGVCGAVVAGRDMLTPEQQLEFDKRFADLAESVACKEIKRKKELSCIACVDRTTEILEDIGLQRNPDDTLRGN